MVDNAEPAVQRALGFIRQAIADEVYRAGDHLPPVRHVARMADVSVASVSKAIARLRKDGVLRSLQRGYVAVAGGSGSENGPATVPATRRWERARATVERDIIQGRLSRDGTLPSAKELQARYGVCFRTMKKVLDSLEADGIIVARKKSYHLAAPRSRRARPTIVLITEGRSIEKVAAVNQGINKLIDTLENECGRLGIAIEFVAYNFFDPDMLAKTRPLLANKDPVVGYFINIWWFEIKECRERLNDLISLLASYRKPIAILDEIGVFSPPPHLGADRCLRVFRIAARAAGEEVARRLLYLGHTDIAYISSDHRPLWSVKRRDGLVEQFEKAGLAGRVRTFALGEFDGAYEIVLGMCRLPREDLRRILSVNRTREQVDDLLKRYDRVRSTGFVATLDPSRVSAVNEQFEVLRRLLDTGLAPAYFVRVRDSVFETAEGEALELCLEQLFDRALADRRITAWVAANDTLALAAIRYLRAKGVRVPDDISVIGFDNIPQHAFENRLTSYDFSIGSIVHQMLWCIVRAEYRSRGTAESPVEVVGMIMDRDTLAKAPAGRAPGGKRTPSRQR
jgi:LacI family transcriptional regulator